MTTEYYWLNKDSRKFLERGYLIEGETPEQRILDIANTAERYLGIDGFAKKFEGYMAKGFYSLSSPIWSNFGRKRGLPISCFGSYIPDTMSGILGKLSEVGIMTKMGGGTSAYFGELRGRGTPINSGGESTGSVHFMELYDKLMNVVSQGNVRRGSFAGYLPIDHPDIEEFLKIRGDGHEIQDMSIGVCVSNDWMRKMIDGDKDLRKIWGLVIKKRFETGYPYIFFTDNANDQAPQVYKDKGLKINNSNLCVTGDQRVVSSLGLLTAKELYEIGEEIQLFDNNKLVNSSAMKLIENDADVFKITLENGMSHTITSYHKISILDRRIQKQNKPQAIVTKNIACEDLKIGDSVAIQTNKGIFGDNNMPKEAFLLGLYQEDESFVCNLSSLNLERWDAMIGTDAIETLVYFLDAVMTEFIDKTEGVAFMEAPRKFAINQRALGVGVLGWHSWLQAKLIGFESMEAKLLNIEIWKTIREKCDKATQELAETFGEPELLKEKSMNTPEVWKDILSHGGSVQHLSFFTQDEKDVFKTFGEISQKEIVIQAAQRQKYIDQGQSLNIMVPATTKPKDINELMIFAWEQGIKSLYYQRSSNPSQELARSINTCSTCEA